MSMIVSIRSVDTNVLVKLVTSYTLTANIAKVNSDGVFSKGEKSVYASQCNKILFS